MTRHPLTRNVTTDLQQEARLRRYRCRLQLLKNIAGVKATVYVLVRLVFYGVFVRSPHPKNHVIISTGALNSHYTA